MYCPKCGAENPDDAKLCSECGYQLKAEITTISEKELTNYAGFWRRVAAYLIDGIVLMIAGGIIGAILGVLVAVPLMVTGTATDATLKIIELLGSILGIVINWLYFTILESSPKQATPGKMALGIIVTDLNGNRISFGRANGRYWSKIISSMTLLIGYIMAGFTEKKQALHDIMAGTLVVKK
ncbi:MAG: RDD family protein [Actinomycetota bacterium]|nr:RDD family protein [Actinomycetota bacterium]